MGLPFLDANLLSSTSQGFHMLALTLTMICETSMPLLHECTFCKQYFSLASMEGHVRSSHFEQWRRTQPKQKSSAPARKVHQLPPDRTLRIPLPAERKNRHSAGPHAPAGPMLSGHRIPRFQARAAPLLKKEAEKPVFNALELALRQALRQTQVKTVAKQALVAATLPKQTPKTRKKERVRSQGYGLQSSKVRDRSGRPPFDGTLHKEARPVHLPSGPLPLPASLASRTTTNCSCGGENERCYRCDGRGYYEISPQRAARNAAPLGANAATSGGSSAGFSSDPRGGAYGIRELGRFPSAPDSDDYGEEAAS